MATLVAGVSLTSSLQRRERAVRSCGLLQESLGIPAAQAEALLISEAHRRGVPVGLLARQVARNPSVGKAWNVALCPVCGCPGQVGVLRDYGLVRVLECPAGHGVVCGG